MNDIQLACLIKRIADAIDENFGVGYASQHPELVAAQLQAGAIMQLASAVCMIANRR
jgi:hypothetical protein